MNGDSSFLKLRPSLVRAWILIVAVAVLSWVGIGYLVMKTEPTLPRILVFFPLLFLALSTTTAPVAGYLNSRLADRRSYRGDVGRPLREGALLGLFVVVCAGLQISRLLNWMIGLFLLIVFIAVEVIVLNRGF